MKGEAKKTKNRLIQERLLKMFDKDEYEEFVTRKYVFVKRYNADNNNWEVAIYDHKSFMRYKQYGGMEE